MLGYYGLQVFKVKEATLIHEPNIGNFSDFLLTLDAIVKSIGHTQNTGCIACNRRVNRQLLLKAQALEPFSHRFPFLFVHSLCERPVCVHATARCYQPRLTQVAQPHLIAEV